MDRCGTCMKVSLICLNIVAFLGGAIAVAIGAWVLSSRSFSSSLIDSLYISSAIVVVSMAGALMLLSLLGCCGAAKEVKCMLLTYYILVFIIFVMMLVGGILQLVFREKNLYVSIDRDLYASIRYYGVDHKMTKAWDDTQTYLQCCGVKGYRDWNDNVPDSCCREVYPGKRMDCKASPNPTTMYVEGCLPKVIDFFRENAVYLGATAIIISLIMLLVLILSCGLFVKIQ